MPYKVISTTGGHTQFPEHSIPPYSIPGTAMPHWEVHDKVVDDQFHKTVYEYLLNCSWAQRWSQLPSELQLFKPGEWDTSWLDASVAKRTIGQPRAMFGSDYDTTKKRHPIIAELWDKINSHLGNCYEISGTSEGMPWKDYPCPTPTDPDLSTGWRVYANGTHHDLLSLQGYAHRDTHDLSDENSVTMLWVSNLEWYPSWGGEIMLYPEDPTGATGDHQQFNTGSHQQRRNFQIGWPDEGRTISLRPNRLIVYDGRTLHSTLPSRHRYNSIMNMRVAFRARKIK